MKICIISNGDAFDKRNWSGTPYNIAIRMKNYPNVDVVSLNIKNEIPNLFYKILCKIVGKKFLIRYLQLKIYYYIY